MNPTKHVINNQLTTSSCNSSIDKALASFNPIGLRALVVDHDPTSLLVLIKMLHTCNYKVTSCPRPKEALSLIREGASKFDILISDVNFLTDMDGMQFLDIVVHETDLPVVIISANDRNNVIMKCVKKGVCAFIPKPARMETVRLLWQHVARREIVRLKQHYNVENGESNSCASGGDKENCGSSDGGPSDHDHWNNNKDEQDKVEGKKRRLVWTDDLHQQFVAVVEQIGLQNAVPKKVLELMNIPGLTRENVASHLQKYRLNLRKLTENLQVGLSVMKVDHPEPNFVSNNGKSFPSGKQRFDDGFVDKGLELVEDGLSLEIPTISLVEASISDQHATVEGTNLVYVADNSFYEANHSSYVMQRRENSAKMPRLNELGRATSCFSLFPGAQVNELPKYDFSNESVPTASFSSIVYQDHNSDLHYQPVHYIQPYSKEDVHRLFDEVNNL